MNPSEIAFLALGLVLGAAVGAALFEVVRARPMPRREVRITVSPNSISPRRSVTLATTDPDAGRMTIPGSPDDDGWLERRLAGDSGEGGYRTRVPFGPLGIPASAVGIPVTPAAPGMRPGGAPGREPAPSAIWPDALTIDPGQVGGLVAVMDPVLPPADDGDQVVPPLATLPAQLDVGSVDAEVTVHARPPGPVARPVLPPTFVAVPMDRSVPQPPAPPPAVAWAAPITAGGDEVYAMAGDPVPGTMPTTTRAADARGVPGCEGERQLVDERCRLAEAAHGQARLAADALRDGQRAYDVLRERVDRAQVIADPREVRAAKDALHRAFRAARGTATTPDAAEHAAREWLNEVNRLNTSAREAAHVVETGSAELRARLPGLERLAVEADAARITAESAEAGCREARESLARCEEAATLAAAAAVTPPPPPDEPSPRDRAWPTAPDGSPIPSPEGAEGEGVGELSIIVRVLRGDRPARERLVASLAMGDADAAREWQLRIAGLVDAISARAIEDGFLDLPDSGFWGVFAPQERREIVGALSALGFRFDGLGGFADGRVPAQRDLSLAVGYAGLDRMRIRNWPREADLTDLYAEASVAADEWLASEAGDLSLGSMVDALGARAAELADVWNAWGRVRPVLLAAD